MHDVAPPPSFQPGQGRARPRAEDVPRQTGTPAAPTTPAGPEVKNTPAPPQQPAARPLRVPAAEKGGAQGKVATPSPQQQGSAQQATPPPSFAPAHPAQAPRQTAAPAQKTSQQAAARQAEPPPSFAPAQRQSAAPGHSPSASGAAPARKYGAGATAPTQNALEHAPIGPQKKTKPKKQRRKGSTRRKVMATVSVILVALIAWPLWLVWHTNSAMHRVDATSAMAGTPGTTYIFAGSDSRDGWNPADTTEGERSDSTIMVHRAPNGQASMVSLPRDSYVEIPGYGFNKLNAAFAFGGPQLLIETVEFNTGIKVDHYVQIGMVGVTDIVDALGGVELCWDTDVSDDLSGMYWTAGCHVADGTEALAFSRMRYEDPLGDVGRQMRQRQVMNAVVTEAFKPSVLLNPVKQLQLSNAAADTLTVGHNTTVWNVAQLMLAMRKATSAGLVGTPPISDPNAYNEVGSVMLWDEGASPTFFQRMLEGTLSEADFRVM